MQIKIEVPHEILKKIADNYRCKFHESGASSEAKTDESVIDKWTEGFAEFVLESIKGHLNDPDPKYAKYNQATNAEDLAQVTICATGSLDYNMRFIADDIYEYLDL